MMVSPTHDMMSIYITLVAANESSLGAQEDEVLRQGPGRPGRQGHHRTSDIKEGINGDKEEKGKEIEERRRKMKIRDRRREIEDGQWMTDMCVPKNVTVLSGQLGDTLTIICPYKQRSDRWRKKLWCREDSTSQCQPVVSTRRWLQFVKTRNGSTSISDNVQEGFVIVTMSKLQHDDVGMYQCLSDALGQFHLLQRVKVEVQRHSIWGNSSEVVEVQYSISGVSSESGVLMSLAILGISLLLTKLLLLGLTYSWWSRRHRERVNTESPLIPLSEEPGPSGTTSLNEEATSTHEDGGIGEMPLYTNYVYMAAPLDQAYWQR
ncbi:triggering receptor expressed on myeloid cells 2-like [Rhinophrynus dorsalis]